MPRITKLILVSGLGLAITLGLNRPLSGEPPERIYEPFVASPEFKQAVALLSDTSDYAGKLEEAKSLFAQIASRNPGTTLGAVSLFQQAKYTDAPACVSIYQQIIRNYPRSRFEIKARTCLLQVEYSGDSKAEAKSFVSAGDRLAKSWGGPSLQDIARNRVAANNKLHKLSSERQDGLIGLYEQIASEQAEGAKDYEGSLALDLFLRDAKFPQGEGQLGWTVFYHTVQADLGKWPPPEKPRQQTHIDPKIRLLTHRKQVCGPRPKLVVEIDTSYPGYPVDLSQLKITLDGQDFLPSLALTSDYRHEQRKGKLIIEDRIRLAGRPARNLSQGTHTLNISAEVQTYKASGNVGPGKTVAQYSFRVGKSKDDPEDEHVDDCWDPRDRWDDD